MSDPPPNQSAAIDQTTTSDLFAEALDLENTFYTEGYALGAADAEASGLREGRAFGIEKGFEKFFAMGRLAGRAAVWRSRVEGFTWGDGAAIPADAVDAADAEATTNANVAVDGDEVTFEAHGGVVPGELPALLATLREKGEELAPRRITVGDRTKKHLVRLSALTDSQTLEMRNTENGVDEFDERLRDAGIKAALFARAVGEDVGDGTMESVGGDSSALNNKASSARAAGGLRLRDPHTAATGLSNEMEDFVGLPGTRR